MGYYTRVDGEIVITPPLSWSEMNDAGVHPRDGYSHDRWIARRHRHGRMTEMDVAVRVITTPLDVYSSAVNPPEGVALVETWDDESKVYYIEEDLKTMIAQFPGHTIAGEQRMEGEDNLDVWKLQVKDNVVEAIYPKLVWPDGTEETYRR
jgi:hypothetical protein